MGALYNTIFLCTWLSNTYVLYKTSIYETININLKKAMATKKKITPKRKTTKKSPLLKKKKTFVGAEVKKTGTLRQGKGRVQTQTYAEGRSGQYVERGPAVVAGASYKKDGNLKEQTASTIKSKGTTKKTTPTANPKIRAVNKKKKAAENKTPLNKRKTVTKKTVAKKKKKTTVKKKKR